MVLLVEQDTFGIENGGRLFGNIEFIPVTELLKSVEFPFELQVFKFVFERAENHRLRNCGESGVRGERGDWNFAFCNREKEEIGGRI